MSVSKEQQAKLRNSWIAFPLPNANFNLCSLVQKQSQSGFFNHDRLIMINTQTKTLFYRNDFLPFAQVNDHTLWKKKVFLHKSKYRIENTTLVVKDDHFQWFLTFLNEEAAKFWLRTLRSIHNQDRIVIYHQIFKDVINSNPSNVLKNNIQIKNDQIIKQITISQVKNQQFSTIKQNCILKAQQTGNQMNVNKLQSKQLIKNINLLQESQDSFSKSNKQISNNKNKVKSQPLKLVTPKQQYLTQQLSNQKYQSQRYFIKMSSKKQQQYSPNIRTSTLQNKQTINRKLIQSSHSNKIKAQKEIHLTKYFSNIISSNEQNWLQKEQQKQQDTPINYFFQQQQQSQFLTDWNTLFYKASTSQQKLLHYINFLQASQKTLKKGLKKQITHGKLSPALINEISMLTYWFGGILIVFADVGNLQSQFESPLLYPDHSRKYLIEAFKESARLFSQNENEIALSCLITVHGITALAKATLTNIQSNFSFHFNQRVIYKNNAFRAHQVKDKPSVPHSQIFPTQIYSCVDVTQQNIIETNYSTVSSNIVKTQIVAQILCQMLRSQLAHIHLKFPLQEFKTINILSIDQIIVDGIKSIFQSIFPQEIYSSPQFVSSQINIQLLNKSQIKKRLYQKQHQYLNVQKESFWKIIFEKYKITKEQIRINYLKEVIMHRMGFNLIQFTTSCQYYDVMNLLPKDPMKALDLIETFPYFLRFSLTRRIVHFLFDNPLFHSFLSEYFPKRLPQAHSSFIPDTKYYKAAIQAMKIHLNENLSAAKQTYHWCLSHLQHTLQNYSLLQSQLHLLFAKYFLNTCVYDSALHYAELAHENIKHIYTQAENKKKITSQMIQAVRLLATIQIQNNKKEEALKQYSKLKALLENTFQNESEQYYTVTISMGEILLNSLNMNEAKKLAQKCIEKMRHSPLVDVYLKACCLEQRCVSSQHCNENNKLQKCIAENVAHYATPQQYALAIKIELYPLLRTLSTDTVQILNHLLLSLGSSEHYLDADNHTNYNVTLFKNALQKLTISKQKLFHCFTTKVKPRKDIQQFIHIVEAVASIVGTNYIFAIIRDYSYI